MYDSEVIAFTGPFMNMALIGRTPSTSSATTEIGLMLPPYTLLVILHHTHEGVFASNGVFLTSWHNHQLSNYSKDKVAWINAVHIFLNNLLRAMTGPILQEIRLENALVLRQRTIPFEYLGTRRLR